MEKIKKHNIEAEIINSHLISEDEINPNEYPEYVHISAGFFYDILPNSNFKKKPEFVYIPERILAGKRNLEIEHTISMWNVAWEAGQYRYLVKRFPKGLYWLNKYRGQHIYLIPNCSFHKYHAYSPLFHLLKKDTLNRFGLPLLRKGHWPFMVLNKWLDHILPKDFNERLASAVAYQLWPFINSGSKLSAFSKSDPIRILAHNLDFWLAYIYMLIEKKELGYQPRDLSDEQIKKVENIKHLLPSDATVNQPRGGGFLWWGEIEARNISRELVNLADSEGKLRAIIDAVQSNRVEDDFSDKWSYAKEDFERKLYRKRSKVKVSFVELDNTLPVHGPDSEIHEELLWEDFLALLKPKEKHIVVCLRSGITDLTEISKKLGYANHSPVSKALKKIRAKAIKYLELS